MIASLLNRFGDLLINIKVLFVHRQYVFALLFIMVSGYYKHYLRKDYVQQARFLPVLFLRVAEEDNTIRLQTEIGTIKFRIDDLDIPRFNKVVNSDCQSQMARIIIDEISQILSTARSITMSFTHRLGDIYYGDLLVSRTSLRSLILQKGLGYSRQVARDESQTWCSLLEIYRGNDKTMSFINSNV